MFKQMMIGVFGPGMERMLGRVSPHTSSEEVGETSSAQPPRDIGRKLSIADPSMRELEGYIPMTVGA
jgi:hypothetical protein